MNAYKTTDLNLAAYLIYEGFKYEMSSFNKRATFTFEPDPKLPKCIKDFGENKALVNPNMYAMTIKSLKTRIYNEY